MRISSQLSDTPIMTLAIAGGILVALLTLFVVETPERMIDTAIHFDMSVTAFFGRFARRSPVVNTLLWWVWTQPTTQAGIVMALLWGAWFGNRETPEGHEGRDAYGILKDEHPDKGRAMAKVLDRHQPPPSADG